MGGNSVYELHDTIHCDTVGFREALGVARQLMSVGNNASESAVGDIAGALGLERSRLEAVLTGRTHVSQPMALRVKAAVGVGVDAELCLGWCDTKGYHMMGVGGTVRAGLGLGANVFAGKHTTGTLMKVILGVSNFTFEYTMPIGEGNACDAGTL